MTQRESLIHEFVDQIPEGPSPGVLYVSVSLATAVHQCGCGCGNEVVTPLSPTGWTLSFDGRSVSLSPSIGNWGFHCRSHYWVSRDRVVWSRPWFQNRNPKGRSRGIVGKLQSILWKVRRLRPLMPRQKTTTNKSPFNLQ